MSVGCSNLVCRGSNGHNMALVQHRVAIFSQGQNLALFPTLLLHTTAYAGVFYIVK